MGIGQFARTAIEQLGAPAWRPLAMLLFILLGVSQVVLVIGKPEAGATPGAAFAIAGLIRGLALIWISVALLRAATDSPRRRWMPDGGFWLYFALSLVALAASALAASLSVGVSDLSRIVLVQLIAVVLVSPLTVWIVAAAVERPLAVNPVPWFRGIGTWLPSYLILALIIVVPLASLHARFSLLLLETEMGATFWVLALADALLSTLVVLVTLSLRLAAYRSVAPR